MSTEEDRRILAVMSTYVRAFETADAKLMQSLHWVDDPNFTEIEDIVSEPFGRDKFLSITDWTKSGGRSPRKMKFYNIKVNVLSPEIAYVIAYQEIRSLKEDEACTSRVSLVFLKKANEWKIIHGHFSSIPRQGN
jgi:uncharacterized protein (TIGR02246 family)